MKRLWRSRGLRIVALIAVGMLLASGAVNADLKATAEVDAWDIGANPPMFAHSQVYWPADGTWMPFLHQVNFDTDGFDWEGFDWSTYYDPTNPAGWDGNYPGGCTGTDTTPWEGIMHWGLYHEDTAPGLQSGFQETRYWRLSECDRDSDGDFDNTDKQIVPGGPWISIADAPAPEITLLRQDYVDITSCGGNCYSEIVTSIFISLDTNCDGALDDETNYLLSSGKSNACFYGEARNPKSPDDDPIWPGPPLQARISTLGAGDKTVSFQIHQAATAVELSSLTARWADSDSQSVMLWAAIGLAGIGALSALVWRLRPARR